MAYGSGKTEAGLNFEAKDEPGILKAVQEAYGISDEAQAAEIKRAIRWDALYHNWLDLTGKDLNRVYPQIGFAFSTIQTYLASTVKTLFPSTPYFQIEPARPDLGWSQTAAVQQSAMDWNATAFQHLLPLIQTMLHSHLNGTGWARAQWKMKPRKVTYKVAKKAGGHTIGYDTMTDWVMDEGLKLRNVPYWMVRRDPAAESIRESRWLIVMEVVSKMRLKQAMNSFPERYNKKYDEITKRADYPLGGIGRKFVDLVNYSKRYEDADLCVVMYVYLPFQYRYLEIVDGECVIRDFTPDNPEDFDIPMKPFINTVETFPTSLQGMSDMAVIEQLGHLQQDILGARINSMYQQLDQVWMYDRDVIPDARMLYGGNSRRIGYSGETMRLKGIQNPKDIITQLQSYPIPSDSYNLSDEIERYMQNATGSNKVVEGGITEEKRTMFEIKTAVERHDQRQALKMKLLEMTGLEMLATDAYKLLGRFTTEKQKYAMLGDKAKYWAWETPFDIPGGINMKFKGSGLMAGLAARQEERLELYDRFKGSGFINEKRFVEVVIDNSQAFDPDEKEEIKTIEQPAQAPGGAMPVPGQPAPGGALPPSLVAAA